MYHANTMKTIFGSWQVWAGLSAAFAGATALLAKAGVADISSGYATLLRTLVVLPFLIVIVVLTGQYHSLSAISSRSLVYLGLSGLATGASWLCYFHALKLGPVTRVSVIDKSSLALVAVLGFALFGERLSWQGWVGVLLMMLGAMMTAIK